MTLEQLAQKTKAASTAIMNADTKRKNQLLATIAKGLEEHMATILKANQKDVETGKVNGMPAGLLDRMMLNEERMKQMIKGIEQVIAYLIQLAKYELCIQMKMVYKLVRCVSP